MTLINILMTCYCWSIKHFNYAVAIDGSILLSTCWKPRGTCGVSSKQRSHVDGKSMCNNLSLAVAATPGENQLQNVQTLCKNN